MKNLFFATLFSLQADATVYLQTYDTDDAYGKLLVTTNSIGWRKIDNFNFWFYSDGKVNIVENFTYTFESVMYQVKDPEILFIVFGPQPQDTTMSFICSKSELYQNETISGTLAGHHVESINVLYGTITGYGNIGEIIPIIPEPSTLFLLPFSFILFMRRR